MELTLFALVVAVAVGVIVRRATRAPDLDSDDRIPARTLLLLLGGCALAIYGGFRLRDFDGDVQLRAALPGVPMAAESATDASTPGGFVTSTTCRACHPGEHRTWHDTFHRRMTQPATVENVLGDFADVALTSRGHTVRFSRRGDEFFVDMVDPVWFEAPTPGREGAPPRIHERVVMTTGSHHLQTYWVRRTQREGAYLMPDTGAMYQVPFVWMVETGRWIPTQDSFVTPGRSSVERLLPWNTSCNMCHSVATEPHYTPTAMDTRSVELGIACEACHGPGGDHVAANSSPLRRYARHLATEQAGDPTIVNPARLDKQRSVEVCGQCHSFNKELDMTRWAKTGVAYRAGGDLSETKAVFRYTETPTHPRLLEHLRAEPDALSGRFWKDGTMRVAGREYNGLLESRCHTHGEMTCLSCHSMHGYATPADQLKPAVLGDESCLQCHADYADRIAAHTHHAADSVGSRCMNCHMPHTTIGLFVAMRSHRIDNPSAAVDARTGRPNACNICHLDRTLQWTAEHLSEWYGQPLVTLTADQAAIAAGVRWLSSGDAAQRAIAGWAVGWSDAQAAAGRGWQGAFVTGLLEDEYAVLRHVGLRSLRTLPGFEGFDLDFLAPPAELQARTRDAVRTWLRESRTSLDRRGPHLLLDQNGKVDVETHSRLVRARDHTPLRIIE